MNTITNTKQVRKNVRFTDQIKEVIENNTKEDAAKILGISKSKIENFIYHHNLKYIKVKNKQLKAEKALKIIELLIQNKLNQNQIAKTVGVSRQYVNQVKNKWENGYVEFSD